MLGLGKQILHISLACPVGRHSCFDEYLKKPELRSWKDSGRATCIAVIDKTLEGFKMLNELQEIIPALETADSALGAGDLVKTMEKD